MNEIIPDMKNQVDEKIRPTAVTAVKIGLGVVLGILLGMEIRDRQLISNSYMFWGVSIVSQQNDHQYMVHIPGYEKNWDWEFCHPLKMPGLLVDIKYEQRYGCKAVYGVGFVSLHKEKNNVELQNGRNSTETSRRLEARR